MGKMDEDRKVAIVAGEAKVEVAQQVAAATSIATRFRVKLARKRAKRQAAQKLRDVIECDAAIVIQKLARIFLAFVYIRKFKENIKKAKVQQEYLSFRVQQKEAANAEEERKAKEMRCEMRERKRMFKEEKRLKEYLEWEGEAQVAALAVQIRIRGMLARKLLAKKKHDKKMAAMQAKWDEEARLTKKRKDNLMLQKNVR